MPHLAIEEILPPDILSRLSPAAARMYGFVWNRMAVAGATNIKLADDDVSKRSRVTLHQLAAIQAELSQRGLMIISALDGAAMYEFPADPTE